MKILILNHYAGSDSYGMEFRPLYLGRELVRQGHSVTVAAADCSHLRKKNPRISKSFSEEWIDGVRYLFVKTVKYHRNDLKRFLNIMSFVAQVKGRAKWLYDAIRPDVVIASSTYPYDFRAAQKIAGYGAGTKVCFELHDIWPMSLIELYHISPKNPYMQSLARAERRAFERSDLVISILPNVDRHIRELGIGDFRYIYIPNGILADGVKPLPPPREAVEAVEKLRGQGKFILMYLGGFSRANALEDLLEAAPNLPQEVQLVMVGSGPLWEEYQNRIVSEKMGNVTLLPAVEKQRVNQTLSLADALYIGAKRSKLYAYGVGMNKLYDYMLAGKPILYAVEASNDPVSDAGCGVTVPAEDPAAISEAVLALLTLSPERRARMGENGRRYVTEHHDYRVLARRFAGALSELFEEDA